MIELLCGSVALLCLGMLRASAEDPVPDPEPTQEPEPTPEPAEEGDPYADIRPPQEEVDDDQPEGDDDGDQPADDGDQPADDGDQPEEDVEITDDDIAAQLEGDDPSLAPQNVDPDEWTQFQAWKQQQQQPVAPAPPQAAPEAAVAAPALELTQEEVEAAFDSPEGLKGVVDKLSKNFSESLEQVKRASQEQVQDAIRFADYRSTVNGYFANNKDIDPDAKSTIKAAAHFTAKHPDMPLAERLELVGEAIRGARKEASKIKRSVHQPRITRTAPAPRTGSRDQRTRTEPAKRDELSVYADLMTTMMGDE